MAQDWTERHNMAMTFPRPGGERLIARLMQAMALSVETYRANVGLMHDDGVLGEGIEYIREAVLALGNAVLILLNGDTGRIDPGTIDAEVREYVRAVGFDGDSF